MTEEHQRLIAEHCSKYENPKMPDLPTSEESSVSSEDESEEESSVSSEDESVEGSPESEDESSIEELSESEASDDDDEDYTESPAKKRRKN